MMSEPAKADDFAAGARLPLVGKLRNLVPPGEHQEWLAWLHRTVPGEFQTPNGDNTLQVYFWGGEFRIELRVIRGLDGQLCKCECGQAWHMRSERVVVAATEPPPLFLRDWCNRPELRWLGAQWTDTSMARLYPEADYGNADRPDEVANWHPALWYDSREERHG